MAEIAGRQSFGPETDPDILSDEMSGRTKRDVRSSPTSWMKHNNMTMIASNSTTHHVSNKTMKEILANMNKMTTQLSGSASSLSPSPPAEAATAPKVVRVTRSSFGKIKPHDVMMGDLESLTKEEPDDLMTAAYDSKKYILVKKKPKHKKIKMEVMEPKMKYKKIKMKVPVKKMKKKKVKGYLVKKKHHH